MSVDHVSQIISCLEGFRRRPQMYCGRLEVEAAVQFLNGFQIGACAALGVDRDLSIREAVTTKRGWRWSAVHPARQMIARGLSDEEVIAELAAIEIDFWTQLREVRLAARSS